MSGVSLYYNLGSQPGRAVRTLIDIGKIPCSFINVDIFSREQRAKPYLDMYPVGKIPVLKDGDFTLGESGAIMIYLCERYPHINQFYGDTPEQRATVNQYIAWYQNYFRPALFKPIRMHLGAVIMQQPISQQHKSALFKDMFDAIAQFDQVLAKNRSKFIAGDRPTIADFLFYYEMTNLVYFGENHDSYPEVKRWFADVYGVSEVKTITHEWYQIAKQMAEMFASIEPAKPKL